MLWALQSPACPACALPGSLPVPQYFTGFVSAIDSAVNPAPHPWKRFGILISLPSPVHLNLNAFCKQDFMHDLPPPSLLLSLSLSLPLSLLGLLFLQRIRVEMAGALVGLENLQCTIVAMEQTDRQLSLSLSPSLSSFPLFSSSSFFSWLVYQDSQALLSFMGGSRKQTARGGEEQVQVWEVQANEKSFLNDPPAQQLHHSRVYCGFPSGQRFKIPSTQSGIGWISGVDAFDRIIQTFSQILQPISAFILISGLVFFIQSVSEK